MPQRKKTRERSRHVAEVPALLPGGHDKFPLKLGQASCFEGLVAGHARVFERCKDRRPRKEFCSCAGDAADRAFCLRSSSVSFRQADDERANRKPVVFIENPDAFDDDLLPVTDVETARICPTSSGRSAVATRFRYLSTGRGTFYRGGSKNGFSKRSWGARSSTAP